MPRFAPRPRPTRVLAIGAAWVLLSSCFASAGAALSVSTTLTDFQGADSSVSVTIDDATSPGDLVITLEVLDPIGDLRGFWIDIVDDSLLPGLSASGADVTDAVFAASAVGNLAADANILGAGGPCFCDIGIEIGTEGIGSDDISMTTIVLSHLSVDLVAGLFEGQEVGARLSSVLDVRSKKKKGRSAYAKLSGGFEVVPEPTTATLALLGLAGLTVASRRRQS